MKVLRLAEFFVLKHAAISPDLLEKSLRDDIRMLWKYPNDDKLFNIISACAKSEPNNPKNDEEKLAVYGFKFCQQVMSMIDYLGAKRSELSLGEIREILLNLVNLIKDNMVKSNVQFPAVSELIFQMIPVSTKSDRVIRDQQFAKAKAGFSRIMSLSLSMLEKISKIEVMAPEKFTYDQVTDVDINQKLPERFVGQRGALSVYDIIDFIRQHGDEFGISSTEDWGTVFRDDPQFKEEITTVINAINRGHYAKNSADVKMEIARILKEHEERKTNFEDEAK